MFRGCIKKWTQFLSITSRFFAISHFVFKKWQKLYPKTTVTPFKWLSQQGKYF